MSMELRWLITNECVPGSIFTYDRQYARLQYRMLAPILEPGPNSGYKEWTEWHDVAVEVWAIGIG